MNKCQSILVNSGYTVASGDDISALYRMRTYHCTKLLRIAFQEEWFGLAIFRCAGRQKKEFEWSHPVLPSVQSVYLSSFATNKESCWSPENRLIYYKK